MARNVTARRLETLALPLLLLNLLLCSAGFGQYVLQDAHDAKRYGPGNIILPFVFYSPTYRFGGGMAVDSTGLFQPQTDTFAYAWGSTPHTSYGVSFGHSDLQLQPIDRLFLDLNFSYSQDHEFTAYINGNPAFIGQAAGINDSAQRDFVTVHGIDVAGDITLKYLLPIGDGRGSPVARYVLEDGILKEGATGGKAFNPLVSGRTLFQFTPFVEDVSLEVFGADFHRDENGIRFGLLYDNSDFPLNPTRGNITSVTLSRDFGWFASSNTWTNISGGFAQFIDLGRTPWFRQRVLALDLWTSYSLTWDESIVNGDRSFSGAPPFYDGATLGGDTRLRAFANNRFWDRAALYGSAELRLTPQWNPLGQIKFLKFADITWMQLAVFAETGRVAPGYTPDLLSHLKFDSGVGLRILANDTFVRFDVAASNEGFAIRAGLSQPF